MSIGYPGYDGTAPDILRRPPLDGLLQPFYHNPPHLHLWAAHAPVSYDDAATILHFPTTPERWGTYVWVPSPRTLVPLVRLATLIPLS